MKKTKIEDLKTLTAMKELNAQHELCESYMRGERDIMELVEYNESFFTGFDREKMDRFEKLKRMCLTMAKNDSWGDFRVADICEPGNTEHHGGVIAEVRCPMLIADKQYEVMLDMLKLADEVSLTFRIDSKERACFVRISLDVKYVFYDEKRR